MAQCIMPIACTVNAYSGTSGVTPFHKGVSDIMQLRIGPEHGTCGDCHKWLSKGEWMWCSLCRKNIEDAGKDLKKLIEAKQ